MGLSEGFWERFGRDLGEKKRKRREMERRERETRRIGDLSLGFPYGLPPAIFERL